MNMLRVVSLLMLSVLFPLTVLNAEVVHLRDGAAPVDAVRVAFVPGGLEAVTSAGETRRFALDQVARIDDMTDPILIDQWKQRQDLARDVWRARSRVQRGDPELALALFQQMQLALAEAAASVRGEATRAIDDHQQVDRFP